MTNIARSSGITRVSGSARPGIVALALAICVAGCSSDGGDRLAREREPAHRLAQQCVSVATETGRFLTVESDHGYALVGAEPGSAERFQLKPSGLGTFLLYDRDRNFLAAGETGVVRLAAADDRAEWAIFDLAGRGADRFTLVTTQDDRRLVVRDQALVLVPRAEPVRASDAGFLLEEQPAGECTAFPEADLDAEVSPGFYAARNPGDPVVGFADLHAHLAFPKALGAVALAGRTFDRFGIEHALADCSPLHGPNGILDLLGAEAGAGGGHATAGYPDFPAWPTRMSFTHMQAYYRWIERAYLGGLRLVVTHVTGNRTYCQLLGLIHPDLIEGDCSAASEVERQTHYVYEIQDYVDAQSGGPGTGWFRVVTSAAQAREVIASNKLAVVLGVEYGELFECRESNAGCTPQYVDTELEKLYVSGVRSVFPIHRFDNAFGGTRIDGGDGGAWMNLTSKVSTGDIDPWSTWSRPASSCCGPPAGTSGTSPSVPTESEEPAACAAFRPSSTKPFPRCRRPSATS